MPWRIAYKVTLFNATVSQLTASLDKQIEKQAQTEALTALERQINNIKKQRDDITR